MKIHNCIQNDADWLALRAGKVTASEMDALLTPEFAIRKGAGVQTLLYKKIAESRLGPLPGGRSWECEEGQMMEDECRKWVAFNSDEPLINVGFCEHDDQRCGCSPDALMGSDGGVEIKCCQPTNHVRYLLEGVLPKEYAAQVHMSLYVTGRLWWQFVSYRRGFPAFVLRVERDEAICAKISEALAGFYEKFDEAVKQLEQHEN